MLICICFIFFQDVFFEQILSLTEQVRATLNTTAAAVANGGTPSSTRAPLSAAAQRVSLWTSLQYALNGLVCRLLNIDNNKKCTHMRVYVLLNVFLFFFLLVRHKSIASTARR